TECVQRLYQHFPVLGTSGQPGPNKAFELKLNRYQFTNVRVNTDVSDALFDFKPPPGTNVLDELRGEAYLVGSAGQELERMAVEERAFTAQERTLSRSNKLVFITWVVVCLAVLASLFLLRRRLRLRAKRG